MCARVQRSVFRKAPGEVLFLGGGAQGTEARLRAGAESRCAGALLRRPAGRRAWRLGWRTEGRPGRPRPDSCPGSEVSALETLPASAHRPRTRVGDARTRTASAARSPRVPSGPGCASKERGSGRCAAGGRRLCRERARPPLSCPAGSRRGAHHERRRSGLLRMAPQVPPGEEVEALCMEEEMVCVTQWSLNWRSRCLGILQK